MSAVNQEPLGNVESQELKVMQVVVENLEKRDKLANQELPVPRVIEDQTV